ncbi:uncharacterized protein LOC142235427 [Haematobia irritans]|uniref:uncharacterized protein LOC142235427 n=1 Tax=Haematobia irritans TaxID=7368 RepID=UPI003F4FEAC4
MQKIWLDRTDWDEVISSEALRMWKQFQDNYSHINSIRIPRWLHYCPESTIQIHGFADSSERAFAAVLYIRISYQGFIFTNLIASKTRVAPLKTLLLPRLKLCGASLLAEMIDSILPRIEIQNYSLFCWTDSTIILSWLSKPACCWNTFVANRMSKTTQVVDPSNWFHVQSGENPADIASRGSLPQDLLGETTCNFEDVLDRFSSFDRALQKLSKSVSNSICQKAYYQNEYLALSSKKSIPSTSPLLNLNPFIDPEGVMRICGRLEASPSLSYNEKHPIILPYACQYSRLLIKFIHRIIVRQQYWIPRVHNLIKTTLHHCKPCVIYKKKCQNQLMAALPPERCELSRPFTYTGFDFAGPFEIKNYAGRSLAKDFIKASQQLRPSKYNLALHTSWSTPYGGLCEAGVKSFKQHFKKSAGSLKYTFEEFQTLLTKIEACLNSRPLTPLSPNPSDINALTPGQCLIESPILVPIYPEVKEPSLSIQNRWQRLKAMYQHVCNRWKNKYLKELQKRHKWKKSEANLKKHMLVVIRDENLHQIAGAWVELLAYILVVMDELGLPIFMPRKA